MQGRLLDWAWRRELAKGITMWLLNICLQPRAPHTQSLNMCIPGGPKFEPMFRDMDTR